MNQFIGLKDGGSLNYNLYSEENSDKGTIIFTHGLTGNKFQLTKYINEYKKEYQIIAVDLRGRGDSSVQLADSSIETHAKDIIEVIDSLQLKRVILFGYSMGAYISQKIAGEHSSVQRVILLDGGGHVDEEGKKMVYPSLGRMEHVYPSCENYIEATANVYKNLKVTVDPLVIQAIQYECKKKEDGYGNLSNPELIKQDFDSFYLYDVEKSARKNDKPTLLITGEGNLSDRPLFTKSNYTALLKEANIQVILTNENHYELAFNLQSDLLGNIHDFLKGEFSNEK
ncbi:alpha/beta hydrolase [Sporosarcina ureae]|uniref:AB hydrolase-1 domain-containing protein n=1 Tax=Sporosarcina ureae TaxID=1571 RepID=A0ABN4YU64_SPOUR|nr:alpha/beta hydrolase [Sporosarcina ureae]ARF13966.1 hypothetical protein SporoS204_07295 [Sporosarcina ureae]